MLALFLKKVLPIRIFFLIFVGKERILTAKLTFYEKNAETNRGGTMLFGNGDGTGAG
jgi:hypothetical protein